MQRKRTFLSIIIPTYNQSSETVRLIESIVFPKKIKSEVIVVDDGSAEYSTVNGQRSKLFREKRVRLFRHQMNKGVAAARNTGARAARGDVLCFLDGDVELFPETLAAVVRVFQTQPGVGAVSGIVVPDTRTAAFFPRYKSLRTWTYWMFENRENPNTQTLGNACFAVRRDIFKKVGGFDERFRGASIEDNELGARIATIAPVIFEPRMCIKHTYESFLPMVRRYVRRSYLWTKLFWKRRRFESAGMSWGETSNGIIATFTWVFPPLLFAHLYLGRRFYGFVKRQEGWSFMLKSLAVQLLLYPMISITAAVTTLLVVWRGMIQLLAHPRSPR